MGSIISEEIPSKKHKNTIADYFAVRSFFARRVYFTSEGKPQSEDFQQRR